MNKPEERRKDWFLLIDGNILILNLIIFIDIKIIKSKAKEKGIKNKQFK